MRQTVAVDGILAVKVKELISASAAVGTKRPGDVCREATEVEATRTGRFPVILTGESLGGFRTGSQWQCVDALHRETFEVTPRAQLDSGISSHALRDPAGGPASRYQGAGGSQSL